MRRLFTLILLLNALTLIVSMPVEAQAAPGILIGLAVSALWTAISVGVQAVVSLFKKPKVGQVQPPGTQMTTAREGEGWPRIWGTAFAYAKVIDIGTVTTREVQNGSGKRRGPPTTAYSCSIMLGFSENIGDTVMGISRMWANEELFYSRDPSAFDGTNPAVEGTANGPFRADLLHARRLQILLGQSTQTDRCDWFATLGDDFAPGYRGLVTVCLDDMDFTPFYGSIPQFKAEVVVVGNMIAEECELAGLATGQIDVDSSIDQDLVIEGPTPFKQILDLFPTVCCAEVDGTLKFMHTLQTSSATVTYAEMGAVKTGREDQGQQPVKFFMSSEQSASVPGRVEVTFFDPDNNYEQASVGYTRQYGEATGVVQLNVPFAMTRDLARNYASEFIARAWTERDTFKINLLPKYLKYHPGDVLTLTAPDGSLMDMRITGMDVHPGTHPCEITGVRQLRNTGVGDPDDMIPDTPDDSDEVEALPSVSVLANVPPLIDDHDNFDGIYWAAGALADSTTTPPAEWKGAFLLRNACGTPGSDANKKYEQVGFTRTMAVIGKARTALANGSGTDTTNTVDVDFPYGSGTDTIVAIHDDAFTKTTTANLAILGKEVIQFRDITDVSATYSLPSGRVWRLGGKIKRGVRDTAAFTNTHAISEPFVLWNPDAVQRIGLNVDEQTLAWNFKTLTSGQQETDVDPVAFTYQPEGGATTLKETSP